MFILSLVLEINHPTRDFAIAIYRSMNQKYSREHNGRGKCPARGPKRECPAKGRSKGGGIEGILRAKLQRLMEVQLKIGEGEEESLIICR